MHISNLHPADHLTSNASSKLTCRTLLFWCGCLLMLGSWVTMASYAASPDGIAFRFKTKDFQLSYPMRAGVVRYHPRATLSDQSLDTLSNWFDPERNYVEIIRQDDPLRPTMGVALSFEFDEQNGEYPYTPEYAAIQVKNFGWGGLEFDLRDTMNYTGISNAVSDDLSVEVISFENDTIVGRFSGLLVSGPGLMASIEEGRFCICLRRTK